MWERILSYAIVLFVVFIWVLAMTIFFSTESKALKPTKLSDAQVYMLASTCAQSPSCYRL